MNNNLKDIGIIDGYIINFDKWWNFITKNITNYHFLFTNLGNKIGVSCMNDKFNYNLRIFITLNSLEFNKELEFIIKLIFNQYNSNKNIKNYSKYYYKKINENDNILEYFINITQFFINEKNDEQSNIDSNSLDDILIENDLQEDELKFFNFINNQQSSNNLGNKKYKDPNNTPLNSDEIKFNNLSLIELANDTLIDITEKNISETRNNFLKNNFHKALSDNTINYNLKNIVDIHISNSLNTSRNNSTNKLLDS